MRLRTAVLATITTAFFPTFACAQAIPCNATYTTAAGDSLSAIAERAYDVASAYQVIFDVNPGVLSSPNMIPIGVELFIPCRTGEATAAAVAAAAAAAAAKDEAAAVEAALQATASGEMEAVAETVAATAGATVALPAVDTPDEVVATATSTNFDPLPPIGLASTTDRIRILTGSDYAPYVDDDLPNGGFSTELVERALTLEDQVANYRVDVISDWGAHLSPLLEDGAYDLGYPWFRPNCDEYDKLGESSQWRCDMLIFSQPLHEIVVTFYGARGAVEGIRSPQDVFGMTICRPDGYFTHDLEAMGLVEPQITRVAPATPQDCFEMLAAGTTDLVSVNADTSDRTIRALGLQSRVSEVIDLSTIQTLHVVGMRNNPATRIHMRRLDQGLREIHDSGKFRAIAAQHL